MNDETIPATRFYELKPSDGTCLHSPLRHVAVIDLLDEDNSSQVWAVNPGVCLTSRRGFIINTACDKNELTPPWHSGT